MSADRDAIIDRLFHEQNDVVAFLRENQQLSFSINVEAILSKTLLLSIGSYFESRITTSITDYAARVSKSDEALTSLVRVKAVERQYHTYFQWREGKRSATPFFGMFGPGLKDAAKEDLKDEGLAQASQAFLELGDLRNLLVHGNFANYSLPKTSDEIYSLYGVALQFVTYIEKKLDPMPTLASCGDS